MQGYHWRTVLRRIPQQQHDNLVIVTNCGAEVVLQEIVGMEEEFVIVRGRMAGSTDTGRVIIVPYDQMSYLGFNKPMTEPEIQDVFGRAIADSFAHQAARPEAATAPVATASSPTPQGAPGQPAAAAPGSKAGSNPNHPSKSLLLARLRARLAGDGTKAP
jgi:hypothetical protein